VGELSAKPGWRGPGRSPGRLAGRSALPLEPGAVDTVACSEAAGGKRQSQRSRPSIKHAGCGRLRCRVGWSTRLRLGVGHASTVRPDLSTLGVVGDQGSAASAACNSSPGSAGQARDFLQSWRRIFRRGIAPSDRLGRHRYVVERSLAWLVGYRRLQVRYERRGDILLGFLHLACALICLKSLSQPAEGLC
jgi:hypothetical protein